MTLQVTLALAAAGVVCVASGKVVFIILGAILIGIGFGPANPTSSRLLAKSVPKRSQNFYFSVKQISIPIAGVTAGLLLPSLTAFAGWQIALLTTAVLCIGIAIILGFWRQKLDFDRQPTSTLGFSTGIHAISLIIFNKRLRHLSLAATAFASLQFVFTSFFVSLATNQASFTLLTAGAALSCAMATSAFTRLFWGWVADRLSSYFVLGVLGVAMGGLFFGLYFINNEWPVSLVFVLSMAIGSTAISWNGVFLAEVARAAPSNKIADATAGSMFFMFVGGLIAPAAFSMLARLTGSFLAGFVIVGGLAILGGLSFLKLLSIQKKGFDNTTDCE